MAKHNDIGKWGEQIAVDRLVRDGCAIVERNWHSGHYEVDIIAMRGPRMVFVEVKTRSDSADDAFRAFDRRKMLRLVRSANSYITSYNIDLDIEFDLFVITGTEESYEVEHIPDFQMPLFRLSR